MKLNATSTFIIKTPREYKRSSFSIAVRTDGKWSTLKSPELVSINDLYKKREISFADAEKLVKALKDQLYQKREFLKPKVSNSNLRLIEKTFAFKYGTKAKQRRVKDINGTWNEFIRAAKILDDVDLASAPIELIQDKIDSYFDSFEKPNGPHKKACMRINSILKYIGRPIEDRLVNLPKQYHEIKFLSWDELQLVLNHVDDELDRAKIRIAFFSGLRAGEIYALQKSKIRKTPNGAYSITVNQQMYRNGSFGLPKRGKIRQTYCFKSAQKDLEFFCSIPLKERLRSRKLDRIMRQACKNANVSQSLTFHDLRHCFAINMFNIGASPAKVADCLGDTEKVVRESYMGYYITDEGMNMLDHLITPNSPF